MLLSPNCLKQLAFCIGLLSVSSLSAQTPVALLPIEPQSPISTLRCGTKSPTVDEIRYTLEVVAKQIIARNTGTTCIAIQPHIVLNDNGSGGISISNLNQGLANLNYVYKDAGIEFYWKGIPNYINNSDYVTFDERSPDNDTEAGLKSLFTAATDAVNIYYVNQITLSNGFSAAGYAYFPFNNASSNTILMTYMAQNSSVNGTFSHELGHYFSLYHTHQGTEFGNMNANAENVPRSGANKNCDTKGDLICDTHADPKGSTTNCVYTGGGISTTDINGVTYTPPVENIMSYYSDDCGVNYFTPEQYIRIAQGLTTRLSHNTYALQAVPQTVANPSGLTVTQTGLTAVLNWTDNASNDMGYLIERSTTSSSSGFKALTYGGTAESATTFTDATTVANTTYYYRIKAANDNCNDYSNVVTITVTPAYCTPTYTNVCLVESGVSRSLERFKLALGGTTILDNAANGCLGAVSNHTAVTNTGVTAGAAYTVTATSAILWTGNSGSCSNLDAGIWLDINNDKDFEDTNEFLGHFTAANCVATGQITIPATSMNGNLRLRVRSGWTTFTSGMSCSSLNVGEAEEYTLTVSGGSGGTALPVELLTFEAKKGEHKTVAVNWETASEIQVEQFVLESSQDGQHFTPLTEVKPQGSAQKGANYVFWDEKPFHGVNYYRLSERTYNQDLKHLGLRSVVVEDKTQFKMFPNPTTNDFELHFYAPIAETVTVQITDLLGRAIAFTQQEVQEGASILKMSFPTTAANGWYSVQLKAQGRTQVARIQKSH
jgi:GEVED domain/Metallo-peptidase family M12B Reprolysin-like